MTTTIPVTSVWRGPGSTDGTIEAAPLREDAWHPSAHRQAFEHWYFDARLDDGHVVLAFLQFAKPGDMKPGVELQVYKPDGTRLEVRQSYPRSAIQASMSSTARAGGGSSAASASRASRANVLARSGSRFEASRARARWKRAAWAAGGSGSSLSVRTARSSGSTASVGSERARWTSPIPVRPAPRGARAVGSSGDSATARS